MRRAVVAFVMALGVLAACGGGEDKKGDCSDEGRTIYCYCSDGKSGNQVCQSDGTYTPCDCGGGGFGGGGFGGSGGFGGGGFGGSGGSSLYPTEGEPCFTPGELLCGAPSPLGPEVFYCDGITYSKRVLLRPGDDCSEVSGHTSIRCNSGLDYTPYAYSGHPCATENAAACDFGKNSVLLCSLGTWTQSELCSPGGCGHVAPGWVGANGSCPSTSQNGCAVCKF